MTMRDVEYRCPHCGHSTRQRPGLDVAHWCPKRRGQLVEMTEKKEGE